jgi:hypothetical protein
MQPWLLIAAALQAAPALNAGPQLRGLAPVEIGHLATAHSLDFRLRQENPVPGAVPLIRGMLVQHDVAPNAVVGIGMSNLYDRRKSGFDTGDGARPKRSRKPAVTFVLKF